MPVENVQLDIAGMVADVNRQGRELYAKSSETEDAERAAQKKVDEKLAAKKKLDVARDVSAPERHVDARLLQVQKGAAGPGPQNALGLWRNNETLQSGLNDLQRRLFNEAIVTPTEQPRATDAGFALDRITKLPGFTEAVNTPKVLNTLHEGVLENPRAAEQPTTELLQTRFMQSSKADPEAKNQFLQFGFKKVKDGQLNAIGLAGQMLDPFASMPRSTQRAATGFLLKQADLPAIKRVDSFVQEPVVRALPSFARGKATELLFKTGANPQVAAGLVELSGHPRFKAQPGEVRGRFFSTIGTGRPSEYAGLITKTTSALDSPDFPKRQAQVSKFLTKLSVQVQRGGEDSVDTADLIKASRRRLPASPQFVPVEGLGGEDLLHAKTHNEAQMRLFFHRLEGTYDEVEHSLQAATCIEDVNRLHVLPEPPSLDTSSLSPEELLRYNDCRKGALERVAMLRATCTQRSRELRHVRKSPVQREKEAKAKAEARQSAESKPRYFTPGAAVPAGIFAQRVTPGDVRAGQPAPATTPPSGAQSAPGGRAASGSQRKASTDRLATDLGGQVATTLSGLGPLTQANLPRFASTIARVVTQEVTQYLQSTLEQGEQPPVGIADPNVAVIPEGERQVMARRERRTMGKTDGWGIQRTFERDLGGGEVPVVRAPSTEPPVAEAKFRGPPVVKDSITVRPFEELLLVPWNGLSKGERALLQNLDWNRSTWNAKMNRGAPWPAVMGTRYEDLGAGNPERRAFLLDVLRRLGYRADQQGGARWNSRVEKLLMGKPT